MSLSVLRCTILAPLTILDPQSALNSERSRFDAVSNQVTGTHRGLTSVPNWSLMVQTSFSPACQGPRTLSMQTGPTGPGMPPYAAMPDLRLKDDEILTIRRPCRLICYHIGVERSVITSTGKRKASTQRGSLLFTHDSHTPLRQKNQRCKITQIRSA